MVDQACRDAAGEQQAEISGHQPHMENAQRQAERTGSSLPQQAFALWQVEVLEPGEPADHISGSCRAGDA